MFQISVYLLPFLAISEFREGVYGIRSHGSSFLSSYPSESSNLQIAGIDVDSFGNTAEISSSHDTYPYSPGVAKFLPLHQYSRPDIPFEATIRPNVEAHPRAPLPQLHQIPQIRTAISNAIDKPVQEFQEVVPPQSSGTAVIPLRPPPATPVNAAAANVPASGGAVFLGSGSIGVVDLGGGAYALGSGGLGYSDRRQNPRTSIRSPVLPPIGADPNLVPAAVNTPQQEDPFLIHNYQSRGQLVPTDLNGYEFLQPDRVGFGEPSPIRPLKTTNTFATPTNLLVRPPQDPSNQQPVYQLYSQDFPDTYPSSYVK